jgi:hypothetical protein
MLQMTVTHAILVLCCAACALEQTVIILVALQCYNNWVCQNEEKKAVSQGKNLNEQLE